MTNTTDISTALAGNYLLVDITLRRFSGYKKDATASDAVTRDAGAQHNAAKVVKDLLAGARSELKEVASAQDTIRSFLYNNTLPWSSASDGLKTGSRLLASSKSIEFLSDYKALTVGYQNALAGFLKVYDARRAEAMANLGTLADPDDYPSRDEIEQAFSVALDITPVPAPADFSRLAIPAEMATALGNRIADQQKRAVDNAMANLSSRITEELKRMARQLGKFGEEQKGRLYASLISNMKGLVDLLRASNFADDARLNELADRLSECTKHDIETIRATPTIARSIAAKAVSISSDIEDDLYF